MIMCAFKKETKILNLDETPAGVDIELRHHLWKFLTKLNHAGTTIILTTHYLEEAEHLCKNVAIIDHGEIIVNTNMKLLLNQLSVQTLILDVGSPLGSSPQISGFDCRLVDETTLEIEIQHEQSVNQLFEQLTQQHIQVASLRNKTNRLEELFIRKITENKNDNGYHSPRLQTDNVGPAHE